MLITEVIIIFLISSHVKILGTCQCNQVEMVDKKSQLVEHLQFNSYIPIPIMLRRNSAVGLLEPLPCYSLFCGQIDSS